MSDGDDVCPACEREIKPGDRVAFLRPGDDGGLVHAQCIMLGRKDPVGWTPDEGEQFGRDTDGDWEWVAGRWRRPDDTEDDP